MLTGEIGRSSFGQFRMFRSVQPSVKIGFRWWHSQVYKRSHEMPCRTRLVSGRIFKLSEDTAASHLERPAPTEFEIGQEMMGFFLMFLECLEMFRVFTDPCQMRACFMLSWYLTNLCTLVLLQSRCRQGKFLMQFASEPAAKARQM